MLNKMLLISGLHVLFIYYKIPTLKGKLHKKNLLNRKCFFIHTYECMDLFVRHTGIMCVRNILICEKYKKYGQTELCILQKLF